MQAFAKSPFHKVVPSGAGSCVAARPDINGGTGFFHDFIVNDRVFL